MSYIIYLHLQPQANQYVLSPSQSNYHAKGEDHPGHLHARCQDSPEWWHRARCEASKTVLCRNRQGCQVIIDICSYVCYRTYQPARGQRSWRAWRSPKASWPSLALPNAHVLHVAPENSSEGKPDVPEDHLSRRNTPDQAFTESVKIFICPMCGQDFSVIRSFSEHNGREHGSRIVQLEMFSCPVCKTRGKAQHI